MSYDLGLFNKEGKVFQSDLIQEGGTQVLGGTRATILNITYNYAHWYYKYLSPRKGLRWLYGKTGKQCIKRLEEAVKKLGTKTNNDYWKDTKGNAGFALNILLKWAKEFPEGVFNGD
jgi:hypothetical protein